MTTANTNFVIIETNNSPNNDIMSGRGTSVRRRRTVSGGDLAEKSINIDGPFADDEEKWFGDNQYAQSISDKIREKNNPAYFVPKIFISHGKVRDQFAEGIRLRNMDEKYREQNSEILITAVGNFINDISELYPAKTTKTNASVPGVRVRDVKELNSLLSNFKDIISKQNLRLISELYKYLRDLPENNEFIFAHRDLHPDNILVDTKTGRVSIIDFELAGYQSKFAAMYQMGTNAFPELWDYIDRLPRSTNSKLSWDFDENKYRAFRFMRWVTVEMMNFLANKEKHDQCAFVKKIERNCRDARFTFGKIKLNNLNGVRPRDKHLANTAIVPTSHYEK